MSTRQLKTLFVALWLGSLVFVGSAYIRAVQAEPPNATGTPLTLPDPTPTPTPITPPLEGIKGLVIEPEHNADDYDRALFPHWGEAMLSLHSNELDDEGQLTSIHWTEICSVREKVLYDEIISSPKNQYRHDPACALDGVWHSGYDAVHTIDTTELDIDHVVPLREAWESGAWAWDAETRELFANYLRDDDHLIAVTASSNRAKGAKDPAEWLPSSPHGVCDYIKWWTDIKRKWLLSVDQAEADAIEEVWKACLTHGRQDGR